jgi:hypothetical protein
MIIRTQEHLKELLQPSKVIIDFDTDLNISQPGLYSQNAHFISLKALCKITALLGHYYNEDFLTHIDIPLYNRMVIKGIVS